MEWIVHLVAVGALITMLTSAFRRGSDAMLRTIGSAVVMVGLAFTAAGWIVHPGMAVLMLSSIEFLYRPYFKVRAELLTSLGCLAAVTVAGVLNGAFPWVVFPLGCMVVLWYLTGGPGRNRRKEARALQRKAFHAAAAQRATVHDSRAELDRLFNDPRIPGASRQRLHAVLRRADRLHFELRSHEASDRLIFEVEQIHEDYAPAAVRGYLALPRSVADSEPIQDGKTGAMLLDEQLTLLNGALDDIAADARTHGAEGLLASYRFLQDKFGSTGGGLKI
jgi:hypothetical protein